MHTGEMKLIRRLRSTLLTFIIFQTTVSTYFLSALQTEKNREEKNNFEEHITSVHKG